MPKVTNVSTVCLSLSSLNKLMDHSNTTLIFFNSKVLFTFSKSSDPDQRAPAGSELFENITWIFQFGLSGRIIFGSYQTSPKVMFNMTLICLEEYHQSV